MLPFLIIWLMPIVAFFIKLKSGIFFWVTGVGTVIIKISEFFVSVILDVIFNFFKEIKFFKLISFVSSTPFFKLKILFVSISNPTVLNFFDSAINKGRPTYPKPTTLILFIFPSKFPTSWV